MGRNLAIVLLGLIALAVVSITTGSFYSVGAGERVVVLRVGAVQRVSGPGLHFKIPWIEDIRRISTRVAVLEWSKARNNAMESYSRDQQPATLEVKIALRVPPDDKSVTELYTTYRDLDGFEQTIVVPRALEGIKTVFGQFNAVIVIQERAQFNKGVEAELRRLITGPVQIEGVQVQDISFSQAYEQSVEQRMQAQVEVERVQQNKAREQLQADIKVIQATADAQSVKLKGDAEASAIRARGDALKDTPQLVALTAAEKWNGVLPSTMVPGGAVPFITLPKQ
jgi:regulator of protease activity HflC (stomatin/prohibitin superfamily)